MTAPEGLHDLVERFERNRDAYRSGRYNETQVRREFIDPYFELLGWDVTNRQGNTPAYQDVVHEDAIKVGGAHKAPDYGFRVGGNRKFFVEAKKPSVSLKDDPIPAFQLRRYGWSAKLSLSILTDFEELAVYDCRIQPNKDDDPQTARLRIYTYDQYPSKWDELAAVFSKVAVISGSFDAYAETAKTKRGTTTVDAAFLKEIESWREALARDLALRNPKLTRRELNFAVQMTIDRIVFLRMTEDRGIEDYGRLQALLAGDRVYDRLGELYRQADERYNSGLFHFHQEKDRPEQPDRLTPNLDIDDGTLKGIIRSLYYPDSPYEFSVLPVEVLGQVYEQFLGKVIDISPDRGVTIEEKPEVRKAGGVYYTPKYIVDYIVRHTVGALLEGKKPGPRGGASKLRIVDPACGSGSFLIGAYQYLLDWHRDRYLEDGPQKHRKELYQGPGGQWLLTTSEKKRILLNNIYGVDIDSQAVEVTKLSLLLKVLEGESAQSLVTQLAMFRERALPDLANNIKCGNSLVGPDFYDSQQTSFLDGEELYRINVFDWKAAFPDVFSGDDPGFDAVIGNPPYVSFYSRESIKPTRAVEGYLAERFSHSVGGRQNTFLLFLSQALRLKSPNGYMGMIVPDTLTNNDSYERTRRVLLNAGLESAARLDYSVFDGPTVRTVVPVVGPSQSSATFSTFSSHGDFLASLPKSQTTVSNTTVLERSHCKWSFASLASDKILAKVVDNSVPLQSLAETRDGVNPGPKSFRERILNPPGPPRATWRQVIEGRHVMPFHILPTTSLIDYDPSILSEDLRKQGASFRNPRIFDAPKLVNRQTANTLIFALDDIGYCTTNSVHNTRSLDGTRSTLLYILGLLNSRLLRFYYRQHSEETRKVFPQVHITALRQLPIYPIDVSNLVDQANHNRMVSLVNHMLTLHEQLAAARIGQEQIVLQHQISATDRQIDRLVYDLYGLTEEDIAVVEEV